MEEATDKPLKSFTQMKLIIHDKNGHRPKLQQVKYAIFNLQEYMGMSFHEKQTIHKFIHNEEVMIDDKTIGWSVTRAIHYCMACFKLSVRLIR